MITLRGITWDHPRGLAPLVATAERYMATHPDVHIHWEVRSGDEFVDYPLDRLAASFDLMVIDHPAVGEAAASGCLLPLDTALDATFLLNHAQDSVGLSAGSYRYGGHQWALAIDAAAQVAAYRADLLARLGYPVPGSWDEVLNLLGALAEGPVRIGMPLFRVGAILSFFALCVQAGEAPCADPDRVVSREIGRAALELLQRLVVEGDPRSLQWDPIALLEHMSRNDDVVYCPLVFGYTNYARPGFRKALLRFADAPHGREGVRGSTLGGTGLAIARHTPQLAAACQYATYIANGEVQRTIYVEHDGQPGSRQAWCDDHANGLTTDFFRSTLTTVEHAYLRPRHNGFLKLQDRGSSLLHGFLRSGGGRDTLLENLDDLYRRSFRQL